MQKLLKSLIFFLCFNCYLYSSPQIYVLYTSALLPKQFELRKQEYLKSFYTLISYGYEPWIIESTNIDNSFFDEISNRVLYPQKNVLSLRNKGVNEVMSIRASIPLLPFEDNDIVIKLTGRYLLSINILSK